MGIIIKQSSFAQETITLSFGDLEAYAYHQYILLFASQITFSEIWSCVSQFYFSTLVDAHH
jgi:hypothetical protein